MKIKIEDITTKQLIKIVDELQQDTFPVDATVRELAIQYFGNESLVSILLVSHKILPEMTKRLIYYKSIVEESY